MPSQNTSSGPPEDALKSKIADLRFEVANLRLNKEKATADADVSHRQVLQRLVNEINDREHTIAQVTASRTVLAARLRNAEEELKQLRLNSQSTAKPQSMSAAPSDAPVRLLSRVLGFGSHRSADPQNEPATSEVDPNSQQIGEDDNHPMTPWQYDFWSVGKALALRDTDSEDLSPAASATDFGADFTISGKKAWDEHGKEKLRHFLQTGQRLRFPEQLPKISIIVVSFNNPHLLFLCLEAIQNNSDVPYELIVVDNDSDATTRRLLKQLVGAKVILNHNNEGFPSACNQGFDRSSGEYLCFLNNDALLQPRCLSIALGNFYRDSTVGAVGGKVISADGLLQEAGAILWCDGTTTSYGSGDKAFDLKYSFSRPVDYCSGAFLMTPRDLYARLGKFDPVFSPGYYEDVDYCIKIALNHQNIIYEPDSVVRHYQNASSTSKSAALSIVIRNHEIFYSRWREYLDGQFEPKGDNIHAASISSRAVKARIVAVTNGLPQAGDANGTLALTGLKGLLARGFVTWAALSTPPDRNNYRELFHELEVVDATVDSISVLAGLLNHADFVWTPEMECVSIISRALSESARDELTVEVNGEESTTYVHLRAHDLTQSDRTEGTFQNGITAD